MAMDKDIWNDISCEQYREYIYDDYTLRIDSPSVIQVNVSSIGGHSHRVVTIDNTAYYIAPGWKAISWKYTDDTVFPFKY